jgi:hypothetical protein
LTAQVVEDILEQEAEVKKEVAKEKKTLQNFIESCRGMMQ